MDYTARYALMAAGQPAGVVDRALRVRLAVDGYYRGRVAKAVAETAVSGIQQETWFSQVSLPAGGRLPDDPTHTQWYATMDYDPVATIARIKVPIVFFFAEDDAYVPVEESVTRFRQVVRISDVTILRIPGTDHFMNTGKPGYAGPTSTVYIQDLVDWLKRRQTPGR
jgi:pimeloyl-ACP methyl ester carboxylesterase